MTERGGRVGREQRTIRERSRKIGQNFGGVHNGERSAENGGQGRVGCRGCARLHRSIFHFSLGNLRPPPIPQCTLAIPFSTLRLPPLSSRPRVAASRSSYPSPRVFSLVSQLSSHACFCVSLSPSIISLPASITSYSRVDARHSVIIQTDRQSLYQRESFRRYYILDMYGKLNILNHLRYFKFELSFTRNLEVRD